jgi:hypothetical protein
MRFGYGCWMPDGVWSDTAQIGATTGKFLGSKSNTF